MSESICGDCAQFAPASQDWSRGYCVRHMRDVDSRSVLMSSVCFEPRQIERRPDPAPTVLPTRESCLSAARDAVVGGREVAYGSPEDNFARIARLWAAFLHNKTGQEIAVNETDVALMLDLVKTARLQHNPGHVDSWVDKAGYSACGCEIGGQA